MRPMDMDLIARLISRWESHGIRCPAGVTPAEIEAFEAARSVTLPPDMRIYFLAVNGMGVFGTCDNDWFSFWPLEGVITIFERLPNRSSPLADASRCFMFSDHSIGLPTYAIRLSADCAEPNPVMTVFSDSGAFEVTVAFDSFSDFVNQYLDDPLTTGLT
jgi:hypothetical protein